MKFTHEYLVTLVTCCGFYRIVDTAWRKMEVYNIKFVSEVEKQAELYGCTPFLIQRIQNYSKNFWYCIECEKSSFCFLQFSGFYKQPAAEILFDINISPMLPELLSPVTIVPFITMLFITRTRRI